MERVRITVEWVFKEAKLFFPSTDMKWKMNLGEAPIAMLYIAASA